MRKPLVILAAFISSWMLLTTNAYAGQPQKEWTMLVFLNGHNNLDSFGEMNIKSMEEVGSTNDVNVVVQWASLKNKQTKRLLVQKSTDPNKVTSPIVQNLKQVDMGDYKQLVEFVRWAAQEYPAKKYFIDVWNHGNGWHLKNKTPGFSPKDISYDDVTGNVITTEQLAQAMSEIQTITGSKVELYGSDACLMAMAEIGAQMSSSVNYMVGSQEVEPGEGWPYGQFLERWTKNPTIDGGALGTILTQEYVKAYSGGVFGNEEVTFSTINLQKFPQLYSAFFDLTRELVQLNKSSLEDIKTIAEETMTFYSSDYKDGYDFVSRIEKSGQAGIRSDTLSSVRAAIDGVVVANEGPSDYKDAKGLAIWLPTSSYDYADYSKRYAGLEFHKNTHWGDFLALVSK